jgi:3-hydroxy-9,10-secoandrosta-1,3,5(10)-triene-9,17-dione monooxygenase reductase component
MIAMGESIRSRRMRLGDVAAAPPSVEAKTVDPLSFRRVLGQYPTGVCVVTAMSGDEPCGMAVGSFTSVSLDPPLVAFLPAKGSTSWPRIRACGRFCVNVLAEDQEEICRIFATSGIDRFATVAWERNTRGLPALTGATAWIDCDLHAVHDAGDHHIVLGRVRELDVTAAARPLIFFQGDYVRLDVSP